MNALRTTGPNHRKTWLARTTDRAPFGSIGSDRIAAPVPRPTDPIDDASSSAVTGFQAEIPMGRSTARTHNGYLLCRGVVIARTGPQLYRPFEIQYNGLPQSDGWVHVIRRPQDVFDPVAMSSFEHTPVTLRHPPKMLNAASWREHSRGYMQNIRRGTGDQADALLGDLVVTDQQAIDAILSGEARQVSNGYYNDYTLISKKDDPLVYAQTGIRGNHIAIVPKGRCGDACTMTLDGASDMAVKPKTALEIARANRHIVSALAKKYPAMTRDALEEAVEAAQEAAAADGENKELVLTITPSGEVSTDGDPAEAAAEAATDPAVADAGEPEEEEPETDPETDPEEEEEDPEADPDDEDGDDPYQDQIDSLVSQVSDLTEMVTQLLDAAKASAAAPAPVATTDAAPARRSAVKPGFTVRAARTTPKAAMNDTRLKAEFQDVKYRADILSPGIAIPTMDAATTMDEAAASICQLRRDALKSAYGKTEFRALIDTYATGKASSLDSLSCDVVAPIFFGVSETVINGRGLRKSATADAQPNRVKTVAEISAAANDFFKVTPARN